MEDMAKENILHQKEGAVLEKKTERMDDVKVASFRRYWEKMITRFVMRDWRKHKNQSI